MPITIDGSGTVTGISAGGLPDNCIVTADIAAGAVTQAKRSEQLTLDTAKASTSGTFIDFTGIPSWVKRVTVMFNGVSTSGTSYLRVQIGAGSIDTSGYASTNGTIGSTSVSGGTGGTSGWDIISNAAATQSGRAVISLLTGNTWIFDSLTSTLTSVNTNITAGHKAALSGTLDRLRITTVNGTDTFDAGSINILYE